MESMRILGGTTARRGAEVLGAVGFGLLAALPEPGLVTASLLAVVAAAIGLWSRGVRVGLAGLAVLVVVSMVRAAWVDGHWLLLFDELPSALLRAGVPWLAAVALRQYLSLGRRADHARELRQRQRIAELKHRTSSERLALAQSLHDDLGHSLSLVALNLGRLELDPALPNSSREAVSRAREDLVRAVERLGDSVVGLRSGTVPNGPDADSVEVLIRRARAAGARIGVSGVPDEHRLEAFGGELVTRVIQEAITNASRHAPGEAIDIHVNDVGSELRVRVTNRTRPRPVAVSTSGTGLADLSRSVSAAGGGLEAASSADQFVLTAVLPATDSVGSRSVDDGERVGVPDDGFGASTAKRAQRRLLVATVAVIVLGLATGEAVSMYQKSRALLPSDVFATIEVGDTREDVASTLPVHELPPRRDAPHPPGCHDYAVTADSFDDAAGDVHRICFSDDVVSKVEYIKGEDR